MRQASTNSRTTSPCPSFHGEEATLKPCARVGHRQKPVQCLATSTAYFAPRSRAALIQLSTSISSGLNSAAGSGSP